MSDKSAEELAREAHLDITRAAFPRLLDVLSQEKLLERAHAKVDTALAAARREALEEGYMQALIDYLNHRVPVAKMIAAVEHNRALAGNPAKEGGE